MVIFSKLFRKIKNNFRKWYQDNYHNDDEALKLTYKFQTFFISYFKEYNDIVAWDSAENKLGRNILRSSLIYLKLKKYKGSREIYFFLIPIIFFALLEESFLLSFMKFL